MKQPLRRGRNRDVQAAQPRRRDLADIDPAHGAPAELEEACEQERAHQRHTPGGRDRVACGGRVDAHVQADVERGGVLGDRGPQQRAAAAERVGGGEQERGVGGHFDDAVDARRERVRGCPLDARALEDLRRVRVDGVGARHLLTDREPDGDQHPLAVAGGRPHLAQRVLEG